MSKFTFALAVLVAAAFAATASAAPTKGKPPVTGAGCKPMVSVILKGTLAANGAAAPSSISVNVTGGNAHVAAWKKLSPVSIAVTTSTKVNRQGDSNPANLKSGDKVTVQARACKADTVAAQLPSLTAVHINARP